MFRLISLIAIAVLAFAGLAAAQQDDGSTPESGTTTENATEVQGEAKEAPAAEAAEKKEIKGSEKKGKYFFKKNCKECHGKKGDGGEVTPISKTIKQWERWFKKGVHTEAAPLDSLATTEQIVHIRTFVIAHAADSDQPETCK